MSVKPPRLISRKVFHLGRLMEEFSPQINHPNKKVIFEIAWPPGSTSNRRMVFSRWAPGELPDMFHPQAATTAVEHREDIFRYEPIPKGSERVDWYLNFADPYLFPGYEGELFAQDEIQVAEHPCLAALRQALDQQGITPFTIEDNCPTPVLVMGAERRCVIDFLPDPTKGRPEGLYGRNFDRAGPEVVRAATRPISPPTITNIIAIAAPAFGHGPYSAEETIIILETAFTGFLAAVIESTKKRKRRPEVVIHTGFWGCGVFGGNRIMMVVLQILAAHLAGVDRLIFYTVDPRGTADYKEALKTLERNVPSDRKPVSMAELIAGIEALGLRWGESDGN